MELLLIRHSMTPGNLKGQYVGATDQPLTPQGIALAEEMRGNFPRPQKLWVSPMTRCRQTAALLFPDMAQQQVPDLRECDFGDFEGRTWEELKDIPLYRQWIGGDMTITFPNGESMPAFLERCQRGIRSVVREGLDQGVELGAAVAHGGTWMAVLAAFGLPKRDLYQWQVKNCGGFRVRVQEEPFALEVLEEYPK